MSKNVQIAKEQLEQSICNALNMAMENNTLVKAEIPSFTLEIPADKSHGDWACNVAMVGAKSFRSAPIKIAQAILDNIDLNETYFKSCEIAGPGFINFFLGDELGGDVLADVLMNKENYGKSDFGKGEKVLVEFVSANPTGPMHIGNARGGAVGDCLASVLSTAGYEVEREFYVNDAGNQIEKFATSLETRYMQKFDESIEMPEDSYHGEDIIQHANNFYEIYKDKYVEDSKERRNAMVDFALPLNINALEADLKKYRIEYDNWFRESTLHKNGAVDEVIKIFKEKGHTYEADGALWFKASEFGVDKDIVLVRANGIPTYIVPDIAYHYDKLVTRGFNRAVDVLGADHHGYVGRMKAALTALGIDSDRLNVVIIQMVMLVRDGETIKLSKRSGKAITLNTLLDEVPIDSARFFFNQREPSTHCDFDLDLAISEDSQNPVYYVQYAYARICSILKALKRDGIEARTCTNQEFGLLQSFEEKELVRHISLYTQEIINSAQELNPSKITKYVHQLATLFHKFYNACRVKGEDEALMQARLNLCIATATVIENVLTMFKITAPESM